MMLLKKQVFGYNKSQVDELKNKEVGNYAKCNADQ